MKLLAKYNRVNILATSIVFMIGGVCYYFILHLVLIKQLDKDLRVEEQEIIDYVMVHNSLPDSADYNDQQVAFEQVAEAAKRKFGSFDILKKKDDEYITIRRLMFPVNISGVNYKVLVSKSQQETEDLIQLIVSITLAMVILLLLVLFIINRFVLNKLWLPFNNTLKQLRQFNLQSKKNLELNDSGINEFKELNKAVTVMSSQVLKDYESLKSFTENASHEIQTPLAVINSKLELLMQSENFTEQQMNGVETIYDEIRRLSRLNQSLLLLTKIDNHQFRETEEVDLARIIVKQLNNYEELIAAKQITLTQNISETPPVLMNETLAGVLITNLITNAIKHNIDHGSIEVVLKENRLSVSNSGSELSCRPEELFERFKKDTHQTESLGLGLSIVKKICEQYNFKVSYSFINGIHTLSILFS
ncbi:MAG: HAMP domain-containing histidine kinase [Chitinophagaceae bacterium]|nr:HAMP domain-containing histidine kinase [Chitinophagaceae bacterium]